MENEPMTYARIAEMLEGLAQDLEAAEDNGQADTYFYRREVEQAVAFLRAPASPPTRPSNGLITFAESADFLSALMDSIRASDSPREELVLKLGEIVGLIRADSCLLGLNAAEPWFLFRGQDNTAHIIVDDWADLHQERLGADHPKIVHAREVAEWMRLWWPQKLPD